MDVKKPIVAIASFFIGALVTGAAAYLLAARLNKDQFISSFYGNAVDAPIRRS